MASTCTGVRIVAICTSFVPISSNFHEEAQLKTFAVWNVPHNPTPNLLNPIAFRFFNLFRL
jgi:hypothetical protein